MIEVKLDWGTEGLNFAVKNNNIVVVVDVLRFSSAVVTAIANGFVIYPISNFEKGKIFADSIGAEISGETGKSKFSLSPLSFLKNRDNKNKKVVLYSPNGAACCELVKNGCIAYIGSLLNAKVVGKQAFKIAKNKNLNVTIVAAGEKRATISGEKVLYTKENSRRVFAVEDYLGCGAIISYINLPKSPEAEICESAFVGLKDKLKELLFNSFSGRYLMQNNKSKDVDFVSQLNYYNVIPVISKGKIDLLK
nr:2-phosphosulfolactate phosphatase [Nanoarchaeum sp.]